MKKTANKKDPISQLIYSNEIKAIDTFIYVILLATILIVPIVLNIHNVNFVSPVITENQFMSTGLKTNLFTAAKLGWLTFFSALIVIATLYRFNKAPFMSHAKAVYIGILLMLIGTIVSTLNSPAKTIAIFGDYQRHEGALALICYITLFFSALSISLTYEKIKKFIYFLYPFAIINFGLGVLNFFNYDVLSTSIVKVLVGIGANVKVSEGSRLLATLPNINYASGVSAVMIGLFLTLAMFEPNKKKSLIHFLISILAVTTLFVSLSNSGFVSMILILILLAVLIFKATDKKRATIILIAFILASTALLNSLSSYNSKVWDESIGIFIAKNPFEAASQGKSIPNIDTSTKTEIQSEYLPDLPDINLGAGSGRLYIWKETLRSIQEKPLFGYGLDTYTYFLNQDRAEKAANLGDPFIVIDKPHNMYLGIAMGAGIFTLIGLFILMAIVLLKGFIQVYKRNANWDNTVIKAAMLFACVAFFFQALFNDSILGVGTIAWILFGLLASLVINQERANA